MQLNLPHPLLLGPNFLYHKIGKLALVDKITIKRRKSETAKQKKGTVGPTVFTAMKK